MKIALILNPYAGLGGSVALKGSDGVAQQAMEQGAVSKVAERVKLALQDHLAVLRQHHWLTCPGNMGATVLADLGIEADTLALDIADPSTAENTREAARLALQQRAELIVFAGGDGTARDICAVVEQQVPVLGIPAGVKIHSSVYAVTPHAAGEVLMAVTAGGLIDIREQEVRDIDEVAFRDNRVRARHYGDMKVPQLGQFIQHTKSGGVEVEELVLQEIAEFVVEQMEPETVYLIGSGKSTAFIMDCLGLPNTLLGIDAVLDRQLLQSDLTEQDILSLCQQYPVRVVISVIGGQGHILGRGNQQLSEQVIRQLGKVNIQVIATKTKLKNLQQRPLIVDTGNRELDLSLQGQWEVLTGYDDYAWYPVETY
ncbi:ATP-NAD kinase family protein [Gynuella sunshinyii]|uniref:ATP-NAD kinase n=1 Tax=Gynuella sunshinyii YC6258 TaxID=1445510 RepID=A0A0C5W1K0_9GAMM|nr:ATP-NAD kinase family protein [Gynuella sunshinyii]AJQ96554.1 hypothetical protein YC6258_04522 [Gynuella sunshinyii YC6258]